MGNGLVGRYKPNPEQQGYDHDAWRQPKARPKKKGAAKSTAKSPAKEKVKASQNDHLRPPKPGEMGSAGSSTTGSTATPTTFGSGARSVVDWSMASAVRDAGSPLMLPDEEEEDEDCANLADAAAKVWEDLMVKREATKDYGALFFLGELKDCVERAAKRVEVLRREASAAVVKVHDKEGALHELCNRIEEKALPPGSALAPQWKLGDMAIRRGKGVCELSMVHHEATPPYYEVRMVATGNVVGTEASNLLELPGHQKTLVRAALRELEQAKSKLAPLEDAQGQAQEELRRQHQALTEQVEKKLRDPAASQPSQHLQQEASSATPRGAAVARSAPPGLPDLDLVKKWSTKPLEGNSPPDLKEDSHSQQKQPMQSGQPTSREVSASPAGSGWTMETASPVGPVGFPTLGELHRAEQQTANPAGPVGFPSLGELHRTEQQAVERQRQAAEWERQQASANSYPTAHPGAAREVFVRPSTEATASGQSWRRTDAQRPQSEPYTPARESSVPAGFPRLDPNAATGQDRQRAQSVHSQSQPQHQQQHPQTQSQPQAGQPYQSQPQAGQPYQQPAQQPQPAAAPTPAPADWVVYYTQQGQAYYHNERTNETVWHLPQGARCRDPSTGPAAQGAGGGWWQEQQKQAEADDPFADLRRKEEEMHKQRQEWTQWYTQYCAWYTQQAQQNAQAAGASTGSSGPNNLPHFGSQKQQADASTLPPRGPQPPTLDGGFEDHATYAIKSSVLKEMEAMVAKGTPIAQRKKALRVLHLRWHPDKNPDKMEVAKSVFQFIEETKPWFLHDPEAEESGVA